MSEDEHQRRHEVGATASASELCASRLDDILVERAPLRNDCDRRIVSPHADVTQPTQIWLVHKLMQPVVDTSELHHGTESVPTQTTTRGHASKTNVARSIQTTTCGLASETKRTCHVNEMKSAWTTSPSKEFDKDGSYQSTVWFGCIALPTAL